MSRFCFVWVIKFVSVLYQYLKQCKWQFCMISPQNIVLCLGWYYTCLMTLVFHTCLFQLVSRQIWPWGRFVGAFASFKVNVAVSRFCPLSRGADSGIVSRIWRGGGDAEIHQNICLYWGEHISIVEQNVEYSTGFDTIYTVTIRLWHDKESICLHTICCFFKREGMLNSRQHIYICSIYIRILKYQP